MVSMFDKFSNILKIILPGCLLLVLSACSSDDNDGGGSTACVPLDASSFPCVDPAQCLSVTATWCFPGASSCTNMGADLTLDHPLGFRIDSTFTSDLNINGCIHDGDETAPGITGPFDENITCSPYVHPDPPERVDSGTYTASVSALSIHAGTSVLMDINVDGATSCQVVSVGIAPVSVDIVYP